jgi:adenosylcobinamide kinase/adenosylcobinamide-phosphate guanylyltransferase
LPLLYEDAVLTLVLGGARSGKSAHAQSLCGSGPVVYVATSIPGDDEEMQRRVTRHRASRPAAWTTIEAPTDLVTVVGATPPGAVILVDCLTVWVSNVLWERRHLDAASLQDVVLAGVVAVSNEVGNGVVPPHPVARLFRDVQGLANQRLARAAGRVVWLVAGLPTILKDSADGP